MKDDKKSLDEVLPKEEKKNSDRYADHLKSPLNELESKSKTEMKSKNKEASDKKEK